MTTKGTVIVAGELKQGKLLRRTEEQGLAAADAQGAASSTGEKNPSELKQKLQEYGFEELTLAPPPEA